MSFARRVIAILLSAAVFAGGAGIPLVEAYCCDKLESVSAYMHLCDDCEATSDDPDDDCCATNVVIKKVEDSGNVPENRFTPASSDVESACVIASGASSAPPSRPAVASDAPARAAPPDARQLLALVCNLRL